MDYTVQVWFTGRGWSGEVVVDGKPYEINNAASYERAIAEADELARQVRHHGRENASVVRRLTQPETKVVSQPQYRKARR